MSHRYSFSAISTTEQTINVRVGCEFRYEVAAESPAIVQVRPRTDSHHRLLNETWETQPRLALDEYEDIYGNSVKRLMMQPGELALRYDALCEVPEAGDPDGSGARQLAVEDLPGELLHFLLPSRYCLSDELMGVAWELFGNTPPGWDRVQAICDWVHGNVRFQYGTSTPQTTSADVYRDRIGVCRDFAHLGVTFCRAMNIPARYVFGYLPDIAVPVDPNPMDFAAWMEVYLEDRWWTFDPRNNKHRVGRVLIGRGRDALDVAMLTTYGSAAFRSMTVWADQVDA